MEIRDGRSAPRLARSRSFRVVRRSPAAWFVRCAPDSLAIRLEVPRLRFRTGPVLCINRDEITFARAETELVALPDASGELVRLERAFLSLHLRHSRTDELAAALREAELPGHAAPVSVPQPGVLRLLWNGLDWQVRPRLDRALAILNSVTDLAPEPPVRPKSWRELTPVELGEHVLRLYDAGRYAEAIEILTHADATTAAERDAHTARWDAEA